MAEPSRKLDYFGTFLKTLASAPLAAAPAPAAMPAPPAARARAAGPGDAAPAPPTVDLRDEVMRKLAVSDGALAFKDLVSPPAGIGALMDAVLELGSYGFLVQEDGTVRLTPSGAQVAEKLLAAPSPLATS